MQPQDWLTLIIAVLGVLHGPLIPALLKRYGKGNGQK